MTKRLTAFLAAFLCAATCWGQAIDLGLGITSGTARVDDTVLPSYPPTPLDIEGLVLYAQTWNTGAMWVEHANSTPTTRPAADGDAVGFVDEAAGGFAITSGADSGRPTLGSDAGVNSYVLFDSNSESWDVAGSASALSFLNRTRQGTILFKYKPRVTAGGTANAIIDSINGASTNTGIYVRRNTAGTLLVQLSGGGSNLVSFSTTTGTCNDPNTWYYVRIWFETEGTAQVHVRINGASEEVATITGAAVAADMTNPLRIGNRTGGSTTLDGKIADLCITTTANVSDERYAMWAAHNPARSSTVTAQERIAAAGNSLTPDQVPMFYNVGYNFSDVTKLWTTSAASVQVASDADKIGYVLNSKPLPAANCSWGRDASQSTDAKRPAYRTNQSNSLGASQWTGNAADIQSTDGASDYTGEQNLTFTQWSRGAQTFIIVMRNNDSDLGSHPLCQGYAVYGVVVGENYPGESVNKYIQHFATGDAADGPTLTNGGNGLNIICVRKDGATCTVYSNNYKGETSTNAGQFIPKQMGRPGITDIDMSGEIFEMHRWNQCLSEATCRKLVNGFATKYAVPNVSTSIVVAQLDRGDWYKRLIASAYGEDHLCIAAPLPLSTGTIDTQGGR